MPEFQSSLASMAITAAIAILIASFFMWIGAKIAGVRYSTFGRSIVAAIGCGFVTWILSYIFWHIRDVNTIVGFVIGLFFTLIIIKAAYQTSFGKALLVWIFQILAQVLAVLIGIAAFSLPMIF